jgi:Zn-dependent protease
MNPEHIRDGFVYLVALIMSICVHEFGHAYVADKLGDPLPRAQGRVTLNPLAHIDPIGTIVLPLVAFITSINAPEIGSRILGWGKPVEVSLSARSMTRKISIRTADILISIAGPAMNILFALLLSGVYVALLKFATTERAFSFVRPVSSIIAMNIGLCFFNLIPCPPLDGGHVAVNLLPRRHPIAELLERYGQFLLFALLMTGMLRVIMSPVRDLAYLWLKTLNGWFA